MQNGRQDIGIYRGTSDDNDSTLFIRAVLVKCLNILIYQEISDIDIFVHIVMQITVTTFHPQSDDSYIQLYVIRSI